MGSRRLNSLRSRRVLIWSVATGLVAAVGSAATLLAPAEADSRPAGAIAGTSTGPVSTADPHAMVTVPPRPTSSVTGRGTAAVAVTAGTTAQYWTPARMAAATSEDDGKTVARTSNALPSTTGTSTTGKSAAVTAARIPSAYYNGRPSIGVVFYAGKDLKAHYCTAFVVNSSTKNLIMMAAHCHVGTWMAFVPGYHINGAAAPYGIWPVLKGYTDNRFWGTGRYASNLDYAFAKLGPDSGGRLIQDVVTGNTLTTTPTYNNASVGVTGYPKATAAPADKPITCWNGTSKLPGYSQMVFLCGGFYGGTSGSPWLIHLNSRTNTGNAIGLIGGFGGGGPNNWTSYSPIFDFNTFALYRYAVAH